MKLSSVLFEQWNLFPALTLCKLCYHIYHMERMTAAAAGSAGWRPHQAEAAPSLVRTPRSHNTAGGAGGGREEGCPLLSHPNLGMLQKAAQPEWHMERGAARDTGLCCSPVFLFPCPLGASECRRALPRALPPGSGEESWPEAPLSPAVPLPLKVSDQGDQSAFPSTLGINSRISEAPFCGEKCCAHSASFSERQKAR